MYSFSEVEFTQTTVVNESWSSFYLIESVLCLPNIDWLIDESPADAYGLKHARISTEDVGLSFERASATALW